MPRGSSYSILFALLLGLACALLLSLPVLPTQDGPMHLYLAGIFQSLLSGSAHYRAYFYIRHLLPPYALVYYLLAALGPALSPPLAEKLIGCLIFILTAAGLRRLARETMGPDFGLASLFAIPLLFNWPFFMGFLNYCLSLALGLWAMAFWCRASRCAVQPRPQSTAWHWRLAWLLTLALMALTHPVPVLLVCGFAWLEMACRALDARRAGRWPAAGFALPDVLTALLGSGSLFYFLAFADKRLTGALSQATSRAAVRGKLLSLSFLSIFSGANAATYLSRLGLLAAAGACLWVATRGLLRRWRAREPHTPADALLLYAVLLGLASLVLPPDLNGQHFFTARLVLPVWLLLLAAAGGAALPAPRLRGALVILAVAAAVGTLLLAQLRLAPAAHLLATAEQAPRTAEAPPATGLLLAGDLAPTTTLLSFDPYRWMGAAWFRRSGTLMLNAGFLDSPVIPVGAYTGRLTASLTQSILESTANSEALLRASPRFRHELLPYAAALVFPAAATATADEAAVHTRGLLRQLDPGPPAHGDREPSSACTVEPTVVVCLRAEPPRPLP